VLEIELETRTLPEVEEALAVVDQGEVATGNICRIMLDNMSLETMREVRETTRGGVLMRCVSWYYGPRQTWTPTTCLV